MPMLDIIQLAIRHRCRGGVIVCVAAGGVLVVIAIVEVMVAHQRDVALGAPGSVPEGGGAVGGVGVAFDDGAGGVAQRRGAVHAVGVVVVELFAPGSGDGAVGVALGQ